MEINRFYACSAGSIACVCSVSFGCPRREETLTVLKTIPQEIYNKYKYMVVFFVKEEEEVEKEIR